MTEPVSPALVSGPDDGPSTWDLSSRFAPAKRADPCRDFCLWPYEPPALPHKGSLRGDALLFHALHASGISARGLDVCDAIRDLAGPFQTVFGIKESEAGASVEFYFYDYDRLERRLPMRHLLEGLVPFVPSDIPDGADALPYFMASLELTPDHFEGRRSLSQLDLYLGNPGSRVSSGLCYGWHHGGCEFRNAYFFFDTATEWPLIEGKLTSTAHAPGGALDPSDLLWPDIPREVTVIANKRLGDAVYFSRLDIDALITCLARLTFPAGTLAFLRDHRDAFAHLLFDIGFDWTWADGGPRITKASWYALL